MTRTTAVATRRPTATRDSERAGAFLWMASAVVALTVTLTAATLAPTLAEHDRGGYLVSGVLMTLADVLLLMGVLSLLRSPVVPHGRLRTVGGVLAVVGTGAAVGAEVLLRIDFGLGTAAFSVAGPAQAFGFLALGAAIAKDHRWHGWHRFTLLGLGIYVPVVLVPALAMSHGQNLAALAGFHTLVLLVGAAWLLESTAGHPTRRP